MSTIQAIETAYKGYRFRSRLEARWAMFYDRVGCEWAYEPQPVSVNGEAYLPDFLVTHRGNQIVHEVKSGHERERIRPLNVYLAGKMGLHDGARAFHAQFIKQSTTIEMRRIAAIGQGQSAALTFGDPLDNVTSRSSFAWNGGWAIPHLCSVHKTAAEQARAHRFDGR